MRVDKSHSRAHTQILVYSLLFRKKGEKIYMNTNKGIVTSGYISITESYAVIAVNSENLCYCRIIFKMHNFKYKL